MSTKDNEKKKREKSETTKEQVKKISHPDKSSTAIIGQPDMVQLTLTEMKMSTQNGNE